MQRWILLLAVTLLALGAWLFWSNANNQSDAELAYESGLTIPELSRGGERGRTIFNQICASCHGTDARGGPGGPPLINRIYEPSHHSDSAFLLAVRSGTRQHHWNFGDMPPQPDVAPENIAAIIAFIRETQQANGIR